MFFEQKFQIRIKKETLEKIDKLVKERIYYNRSDFIRIAINKALVKHERIKQKPIKRNKALF